MRSLVEFLKCGVIFFFKNREAIYFRVTKFHDITDKIIPFFEKYRIYGVKALDFADFCQVAELMKNKKHLTADPPPPSIRPSEGGAGRTDPLFFLLKKK